MSATIQLIDDHRLEKNMQPPSESTRFEEAGRFVEYVGTGKLRDKKALITGGEYVLKSWPFSLHWAAVDANIAQALAEPLLC
jgi:hypothetical protein